MLNTIRGLTHLALSAMLMAAMALTATLVAAPSASAAGAISCDPPGVIKSFDGGLSYSCVIPGTPGDPGDPSDGGGSGEPTCDLDKSGGTLPGSAERGPNFCMGTDTCFNTGQVVPMAPPKGDPPNEDSEARMTWCYTALGGLENVRTFWSDDEEPPTLLQQAQEAIGKIELGDVDLEISPANRTLVNLDTWYWLGGARPEATGSSAFGLVAIATLDTMTVDPGDGTASFGCPLVTSADQAKDTCTHTYRRASNGGSASVGGRPAYAAKVTSVYTLRFEVNGNPVDVAGAPATLDGPPGEAALRVDELQSRVTRLG